MTIWSSHESKNGNLVSEIIYRELDIITIKKPHKYPMSELFLEQFQNWSHISFMVSVKASGVVHGTGN